MVRALIWLALPVAGALVVAALLSVRRPAPPALPAPSDPSYRLAQRMARVLDRQLQDDLVRPVLPAAMREEIEWLVDEFYGDDTPRKTE